MADYRQSGLHKCVFLQITTLWLQFQMVANQPIAMTLLLVVLVHLLTVMLRMIVHHYSIVDSTMIIALVRT
jgi:hypothetical protein